MELTGLYEFVGKQDADLILEASVYEPTADETNRLDVIEQMLQEGTLEFEQIERWLEDPVDESVVGKLLGGVTGFALGKRLGKILARVLGLQKGLLYDMFTSRLFGAALGANLGRRII